MSLYQLISFELCPYVQRSVIVLAEKRVEYDVEFIDLHDKPAWFSALSPLGKVPVLVVDDVVLFESAVINEYLDESAPGKKLHPGDPLTRAYHRSWIEFGSQLLFDVFQTMVAKDELAVRECAQKLKQRLVRLDGQLSEGPYFSGSDFCLVDAALAPALLRASWIQELAPQLQLLDELPTLAGWTDAVLAHPSVKASVFEGMHEQFVDYLRGKRSPSLTMAASWLGRSAG